MHVWGSLNRKNKRTCVNIIQIVPELNKKLSVIAKKVTAYYFGVMWLAVINNIEYSVKINE